MDEKFNCTKCGLCCMHISGIKELQNYDLGNGDCKFFDTEQKICKIYNERPLVCMVDKMYETHFKTKYNKMEFYNINAKICNELQEKHGIDNKYRMEIK